MNDHEMASALLNGWIDRELDEDTRLMVESHLPNCESCSKEVEFLLKLRAEARALPREMEPSRDLWQGIAARIQSGSPPEGTIPIPPKTASRFTRRSTWTGLAAAAGILVAMTAATLQLLNRSGDAPSAAAPIDAPAETRPLTALAAFEPTEQEYLVALADLERLYEARRSSLSPETVAVIDQNLRIIDAAIADIRAALEAESTNVELPFLLSGVYRSKVDLLDATTRLHSRT